MGDCKSEPRRRSFKVNNAVKEWKDRRGFVFEKQEEKDGSSFHEEDDEDDGGIGRLEGENGNWNGSLNETDTYDDMLRICWAKQECWSCIGTESRLKEGDEKGGEVGCSWCPSVCSFFLSLHFIAVVFHDCGCITSFSMS
jgi:hypothetical protein